jgi:hypothetical protein
MNIRKLFLSAALLALAAGSVYAADLPNPFKDPKVGDWVVHQIRDNAKTKQTIVSLSDKQVVIEIETYLDGKIVNTQTRENERIYEPSLGMLGIKEGGPEPKITKETLTIKGKKLECTVIEQVKDGTTAKTWISEDIPVNGLVKVEVSGAGPAQSGTMVVIDWGRGK